MNNQIYIKDNALSKEFCEKMIEEFHQNVWMQTPGQSTEGVDTSIKDSTDISFYWNSTQDFFYVRSVLATEMIKWQEENPGLYNLQEWDVQDGGNVQHYKPGGGYHHLHSEWSFHNEEHAKRIGAWMFFLNDIKEGGGTEFPQQDFIVEPKQGRLVLFPAYWTHLHKGQVAPNEDKYIITGWFGVT
tara:strand:+ start:813 stop:1370 length:558 start_codon:yes stop_codon:yes gene_type:complete